MKFYLTICLIISICIPSEVRADSCNDRVTRREKRNVEQKILPAGRRLADSSEENSAENQCAKSYGEDFLKRLTDMATLRQWWTGPNVCKRVDEKTNEISSDDMFSFGQSCQFMDKIYKCIVRKFQNGTEIIKTTIYQCCLGFQRSRGDNGCPKQIEVKTLQETLESLNLTRFSEAMKNAGLQEILGGNATYTIFAPSNEAFESPANPEDVGIVTLDTADKNFAKGALLSHIVPGWLDLDSMEDEENWLTLKQGSDIRTVFYYFPRVQLDTANCAKITKADHQTTNGYVHVVDRILPQASKTLWAILQEDSKFSTFNSLLDEKLKNLLNDPSQHFTVFAFVDQAFEKLPGSVQDRIKSKQRCVSDVIMHHIAHATICGAILEKSVSLWSLSGQNLISNASESNNVKLNGKKLIGMDKVSKNGVLHVIEGVLMFPHNQDLLSALETIGYGKMAAMVKSDPAMEQKLMGKNDTVLFLPPFESVQKLLNSNDSDASKLKLLANHFAENLDEQTMQTFSGVKLDIGITRRSFFDSGKLTVGCANMVGQMTGCGGTIKRIDRILPIPTQNVADLLQEMPEFSEFNKMLTASGLNADFKQDNKSFTVFVPTNDALEYYILPEERAQLMENLENLKNFIRTHIVDDRICCNRLAGSDLFGGGPRFTSRTGSTLRSGSSVKGLLIGGSSILRCNLEATNGILHAIDRPFLRRRHVTFDDDDFFSSFFRRF